MSATPPTSASEVSLPPGHPVRRPNFFIIGAPKCGTSSLQAALVEHPDLFMPALKEPHFFGRDHERLHHEPFTERQYLALFAGANDERGVGEASTSYLHSTSAAEEIHGFVPQARIIVMLRNPVDVMHAYHATNVAAGFEPVADFEQALALEAERRSGRGLPPTRPGIRESLYYRDVATFSPQLLRFQRVFGRDAVKVVMFDDWVVDAATSYADVARFLAVDPDFRPGLHVVNQSRRVRFAAAHRVLHAPPPAVRRLAAMTLSRPQRARILYAVSRANTRTSPRPPLRPELRRELLGEFALEIDRLGRLLGRDLSPWARDEKLGAGEQV